MLLSQGCWYSFTSWLGMMWNTKQMQEDLDREVYVKTTIRELAVYLIFISLIVIREDFTSFAGNSMAGRAWYWYMTEYLSLGISVKP